MSGRGVVENDFPTLWETRESKAPAPEISPSLWEVRSESFNYFEISAAGLGGLDPSELNSA